MKRSRLGPLLLLVVGLWATAQRVGLIAVGPDTDTDAFAHARIARRMLTEWGDLRIHWVWLPLWHCVGALGALLHRDLLFPRLVSLGCSVLSPWVLSDLLRPRAESLRPWLREAERVIPWVAGALLAVWPFNLGVGASGEPEALFQLLVLLTAWSWSRGHPVTAGTALACATLLRYEAWPLPFVMLTAWCFDRRTLRSALAWLLPVASITAWGALHWYQLGEPLQFLGVNRRYIVQAWVDLRITERNPPSLRYAPVWYLALVPHQSVGAALAWAIPGVAWVSLRSPRVYTALSAALLALVTAVWMTRTNLGLLRHFAVLIPFYAAAVAAGVCVTFAWAAWALSIRLGNNAKSLAATAALVASAVASAGVLRGVITDRATAYVATARRDSSGMYVRERRVAEILRGELTGCARAFYDLEGYDVFSGLPAWRFIRWDVPDVRDFNTLVEAAQCGKVLVVSRPQRVTQLRRDIVVLYRDDSVAVLRRGRPAVVTPWLLSQPRAEQR